MTVQHLLRARIVINIIRLIVNTNNVPRIIFTIGNSVLCQPTRAKIFHISHPINIILLIVKRLDVEILQTSKLTIHQRHIFGSLKFIFFKVEILCAKNRRQHQINSIRNKAVSFGNSPEIFVINVNMSFQNRKGAASKYRFKPNLKVLVSLIIR